MRLRSLLLAAALSALVLAGCGSENDALIPAEDADTLSALVADAGAASEAGECDAARRSVREAEQQLDALPRQTSRRLKGNLRDWLDHLDRKIADDCEAQPEETQTPAPTATEDPGTGDEVIPEEPPDTGGVSPEEDG